MLSMLRLSQGLLYELFNGGVWGTESLVGCRRHIKLVSGSWRGEVFSILRFVLGGSAGNGSRSVLDYTIVWGVYLDAFTMLTG